MNYVDEMALQFGPDDDVPVADQEAVIEAFHEGTGRVAVDAAAGTGKTTTMLTTVAEVVVSVAETGENPFESLLLTTFTRDAATELQEDLREVLRNHVDAGGDLPSDVFRWLETDSQIRTIDSLFNNLLSEVATELSLPPTFEIESSADLQEIRDEIFSELRTRYLEEFSRLENAYPDESWRTYPPDTVREMIENAQQKCREFCITPEEAGISLLANLDTAHGGQTPPETFDDVRSLMDTVVFQDAELSVTADDTEEAERTKELFTEHVADTYERSRQLVDDFSTILTAYERRYDELTRERGHLTYQDATHVLRTFVERNSDHPFVESLRCRFDHVFIDEFQDTSAAQCRVLREMVTDVDGRTRLLAIGDVKQSIYQWRSADPNIFGEIVSHAEEAGPDGGSIPHLDADGVVYRALTSNFRSHPDLITAANGLFGSIFDDPSRGGVGDVEVSYNNVDAAGPRKLWDDDSAHFHVLSLDLDDGFPSRGEDWTPPEAERVASRIAAIVDEDSEITVFDGVEVDEEVQERTPNPGDITLLFQARTHMQQYVDALSAHGIDAAPKASGDLFDQPEITLLIDVLYWFTNPHDKASLMRILRSPFVACSDETIRMVASEDFYIAEILESKKWPSALPDADRRRLESLVELRDELRWDREGSKTDLLNRIIRHAAFDAVVLADEEGLRRYGNVWALTEIIDGWEEEELLPYREFVERLTRLRDRAGKGHEPDHTVAEVADPADENTVTLTTVHAAKGLEYPIVFLVDTFKSWDSPPLQAGRLVSDRDRGLALRPVGSNKPLPEAVSFENPDDDAGVWMNEDRDVPGYPKLTGPIWISNDINKETGEFTYTNPLNEYLAPSRAEYWRVLYVAFTRAEDHLFLGLADLEDWVEDYTRWTTWAVTLNEVFGPDSNWSEIRTLEFNTHDNTIQIGVDDVTGASPITREPVKVGNADRYLNRDPVDLPDTVPYRPDRVSPSRIHDLVECPRRYQYQHVQEITGVHGEGPTLNRDGEPIDETATPGGINPAEWGTKVHQALEYRLLGRDRLSLFANSLDDDLREYVLWVVESMEIDSSRYRAALSADEMYPEHTVSAVLDVDGSEVIITGEVDLLYKADGVWNLADYKTTSVHDPDSYAGGKYARQLRTYAWLLERTYDVEVGELSLLYVNVDKTSGTVDVTPVIVEREYTENEYTESLRNDLRSVESTSPKGLSARPTEERCRGCPYSASRGGPCEHGD